MIIFAEKKHISDVAALWNEAFGDKAEDILVYLKTLIEYCVIFEEDNKVAGMLFLLPVSCGEKKGRYVYAVATLKNSRGKGISSALLEFAKDFISNKDEDFLILVPQSESLFEFYKKRGFYSLACVNKATVKSVGGCEGELELKKIPASQYYKIRKKFLDNMCFVEWNTAMLNFAKKMYCGDFLEIMKAEKSVGAAFVVWNEGTIMVKELLSNSPLELANELCDCFNAEKICISYPCNAVPSVMMYPEAFENVYFNIALD